MFKVKTHFAAWSFAVAASLVSPVWASAAGPLEEVDGVALDHLEAAPGFDWSAVQSVSITVEARFEEDRDRYNLDTRETQRLVEDLEKEIAKDLERRADLSVVEGGANAYQLTVAITDVDVNLPESARHSVRSTTVSRWNGALEVEGTLASPGGAQVLANFEDDIDDQGAFFERQSSTSVRFDMARLAGRSASRIAGSFAELRGE